MNVDEPNIFISHATHSTITLQMAPVAPPLYKLVTNCTAADGNGVGINNVSAFWDEDWWEMMWVGKTREDMIEVVSKRSPRNLLRDREIRRHQKVVDATTGEMVGYARWLVPSTHTSCWLDAQTPAVSTAEDQEYQAVFDNTPLNPRDDMDGTDDHIGEWRKKRDLTRPYLREFLLQLAFFAYDESFRR